MRLAKITSFAVVPVIGVIALCYGCVVGANDHAPAEPACTVPECSLGIGRPGSGTGSPTSPGTGSPDGAPGSPGTPGADGGIGDTTPTSPGSPDATTPTTPGGTDATTPTTPGDATP